MKKAKSLKIWALQILIPLFSYASYVVFVILATNSTLASHGVSFQEANYIALDKADYFFSYALIPLIASWLCLAVYNKSLYLSVFVSLNQLIGISNEPIGGAARWRGKDRSILKYFLWEEIVDSYDKSETGCPQGINLSVPILAARERSNP
jgi:hypothetical protein